MQQGRRSGAFAAAATAAALLVAAVAGAATAPTGGSDSARRADTEAQLKAVQAEIARVRAKVSRDRVETDKAARDLRSAELSVGTARAALDELQRTRAERAARRAELAAQKRERTAQIERERAGLAAQMRAAYLIGRAEPLKLLLNQQDPSRAGRLFVYYSYFGRARAGQVAGIEAEVGKLEQLDTVLAAEEAKLAQIESERRDELARLESARSQRGAVLASLKLQSQTRAQTLERLQKEQGGLESLLRELRRALEKFPVDSNDAFARLKGKLAWPVAGQLAARFGETRAGAVKWDGVLISAERGSDVRAVYGGRIIFADWLPGLGLLTIVDHGDGYLSLYGHNERLFKAVGERVAPGDTIAAAGDSGGSEHPELYFGIRKGGRPVDPVPWFKASHPGPD